MPRKPKISPVAGKDGQLPRADKARNPLPPSPRFSSDPRIQDIMVLARERTYWMQMRMRNTARLAAEIRGKLHPGRAQDEAWTEEAKTMALEICSSAVAQIKRDLENGRRRIIGLKERKPLDSHAHPLAHADFVTMTARSLAEWELKEDSVLDQMVEITTTLEIAPFCESPDRKGFTLAGLAVIIGHTGDVRDYPKKGHLWKRLGLAPYSKDGVTRAGSSWGKFGGLAKDDWIALGYKRQRLGDIFGKVTQPLLYAQWRATGAIGRYGEAYGTYKARQQAMNESGAFSAEAARQAASAKKAGIKPRKELLEGKLTAMAINRRALRYMTKKLIADLWSAWRMVGLDRLASKEARSWMPATAKSLPEGAGREKGQAGAAGKATFGLPSPAISSPPKAGKGETGHIQGADRATVRLPLSPPHSAQSGAAATASLPKGHCPDAAATFEGRAISRVPQSVARCFVPDPQSPSASGNRAIDRMPSKAIRIIPTDAEPVVREAKKMVSKRKPKAMIWLLPAQPMAAE